MSFADDIRELDKQRLAEQTGSANSPAQFVVEKFMGIWDTVDDIDEKGNKIKRRVLAIEGRTRVKAPLAFATFQTMSVFISKEFGWDIPEWAKNLSYQEMFIQKFMIDMMQQDGFQRSEAERILSSFYGGKNYSITNVSSATKEAGEK